MAGWIKLHRSIQEHWLYTEKRKFSKFEAWNDILLTVNYTEGKAIIKGKLIQIKRGESILSLDSWAKRWSWDKSTVRRFLNTLQKDNMIELKNETITTRLIVCKYDTYQDERNANETHMKRKRNANETHLTPIEEEEESKEEKEINNISSISDEISETKKNELLEENNLVKTEEEKRKKVAPKKEKEILEISNEFLPVWTKWKEYRKDKKMKNYAGPKWEQIALNKLIEISTNNPTIANEIVNQSIENNYQGLFPLKNNSYGNTTIQTNGNGNDQKPIKRSGRSILAERLINATKANGESGSAIIDAEICE
jgi:DNA-binding transcriptional regulator YhcF (GntR family)